MKRNVMTGHIVALVGNCLLIFGLFLPWVTAGMLQVSGFQKIADAKYLLILGLGGILISIIGLGFKKNMGILIALDSLLSGGLLTVCYYLLEDNLSGNTVAQIGGGFWLCAGAIAICFFSLIMMVEFKKKT